MPNYTELPPEFAALAGKVQFVQRINENEYHSSCPQCGVEDYHNESNPSDRFVMWRVSNLNSKPFGMCVRHCRYKWSDTKADADWTPEERAAFELKRKELQEREEARIVEYAQSVVMKQGIYKNYNTVLKNSKAGIDYLFERGFDEQWINHLEIGIMEDYKVKGRNSTYFSPAITHPVIAENGRIENIKMRVMYPTCTEDRYRSLYATKAQHYHLPNKEPVIGNRVILVEGEFKSDVVAMWGRLPVENLTIIGTQGKGIGQRLIKKLEKCEVVYLALDPDAFLPDKNNNVTVAQVARQIGIERVRFIPVKQKPDDAIMQGWNMLNAFNMAIKPTQWRYFK